ncbi:hypothetical protein AX14_014015, partial [Amanita brunnescens Koide BX004]
PAFPEDFSATWSHTTESQRHPPKCVIQMPVNATRSDSSEYATRISATSASR